MERKVLRKKLKEPDEFISFWGQAYNYMLEHQRQFVGAAVTVLCIAALVAAGWFYWSTQKNRALAEFNKNLDAYVELSQVPGSTQEKFQELGKKFEAASKKYSSTPGGVLCLLYAGNSYFEGGDYPRATTFYKDFLLKAPQESSFRALAALSLGYCYEIRGEYPAALDSFGLVLKGRNESIKEKAALDQARVYELMKDKKKAASSYQDFLTKYPESPWKDEVKIAKQRLES